MNIFYALKPLHCVCKFFGLVPIRIVANERGYVFSTVSSLQLLYGIILLLSINIPFAFTYYILVITPGLISIFTALIQLISTVSSSIIAYFCCLLQCRKVLAQIIKLDTWDSVAGFPPSVYCTMRRKLIACMIMCAIAELLLSVLSANALGCSSAALINCVSCFMSSLQSLLVEFQFVASIIILRQRYAFLNARIDEECDILKRKLEEKYEVLALVGQIDCASCVLNRTISFKRNSIYHKPTCNNIMKLHCNLCDIVQEINYAYSPCLVVNTAKTFTTLTYCLHYLIIAYGLGGIRNNSHIALILMHWVAVLITKVVFVVHSCNSSSNEVRFQVLQAARCKFFSVYM
jgi:hypothetical protein